MGYSFAAGTVDGPGAFSFKQGTLSTNPTWNIVRNILASPTENDILCQAPKPILLATGRMKYPFDWQPSIVSTQLALIGNVALIAVPGEFTTMSGRRMKKQITKRMMENGLVNPWPIIAGLSNTYSDYITTFEEYQYLSEVSTRFLRDKYSNFGGATYYKIAPHQFLKVFLSPSFSMGTICLLNWAPVTNIFGVARVRSSEIHVLVELPQVDSRTRFCFWFLLCLVLIFFFFCSF
ncbi:ceramidase, putative [Pediculus humanus corporis]|uniref:Neutral ceramidase n=1 Tax=Pediculus humanus subsp. corporis TaxID=121224 RepID=E0W4J0_PEDHC|nr:ceramidase, putative [Pediculus humanus corporis]EEB20546.1 ceramidase, putative [Pediculus humanus corporis]